MIAIVLGIEKEVNCMLVLWWTLIERLDGLNADFDCRLGYRGFVQVMGDRLDARV